jgi:NADH-quinone oxidoreductase subunit J
MGSELLISLNTPMAITLPAAAPGTVMHPLLVLVLCLAAGVGTVLALPGKRETSWAKIGGVIALATAVIFAALLAHHLADIGRGGMGPYFWIFSFLAVFGAFRVITHRRPVYSALYFVLTVMASAGLFVLLWAEFMAAALVVIYAGAILVTYVFVIMLASQAQTPAPGSKGSVGSLAAVTDYDTVSRDPLVASLIGFALMGMLLFVILDQSKGAIPSTVTPPKITADYDSSVQELGRYLMTDQLVNLELAGLILAISMMGAIIISRRRIVSTESGPVILETEQSEVIAAMGIEQTGGSDPDSIPVYGTHDAALKGYPER